MIRTDQWEFPEVHSRVAFGSRARERIFLREKGVCHICKLKIHVGEKWEVEHKDPLWAAGSPKEEDCAVAHVKCHKVKTAAEAPQRAKEHRIRQKHIGAFKKTARPIPGSRSTNWKRKLDGSVERRS